MVKPRALSSPTPGVSATPPQHMYLLEGGLLVVSNLLKTVAWVKDTDRSHCTVCVQQFLPFRRRHHCRTCGEVVCANCSAQRKIHLTEVNVECATRVCSFCMIRATDESIRATANGAAMRESVALYHGSRTHHAGDARRVAIVATPATAAAAASSLPRDRGPAPPSSSPSRPCVTKQMSMLSLESELTDGSVVQLWPPGADETARLEIARREPIRATESDPTMALLVSIVARTLECPVAFIGILDDQRLLFKAAVGWDRDHIPRDDCVCAAQQKTMIVADTNQDKHFLANSLALANDRPMRYYAGAPIRVLGQCIGAVCAIDSKPHWETSAAMKSTLEAIANIVSEVLEQRVDGSRKSIGQAPGEVQSSPRQFVPMEERTPALSLASTVTIPSPVKSRAVPSVTSCDSESTFVDVCDHMRDLQVIQYSSESSLESDEDEFSDDEEDEELSGRASETAMPTSAPVVHPWPTRSSIMVDRTSHCDIDMSAGSRMSMPRFSLAVPTGPPEITEKVGKAMEFFQALQSSRWSACSTRDDEIISFELLTQGRHFTKSHAVIAGDCTHVIARLQTYDDSRLYSDLFEYTTQRRQKINVQTWIDHVQLRPGFESAHYPEVNVLSHWRQYPDGSNVIIAFNDSNQDLLMIEDFLFGWFIAPSGSNGNGNCCVNISSIVAEPVAAVINENQSHHGGFNLSKLLVERLRHTLPYHYEMAPLAPVSSNQSLSTSSNTSSLDNQRIRESSFDTLLGGITVTDSMALMGMRSRRPSSPVGEKMVPIRTRYNEPSSLNDNERMMLDLLDKTISTQEVLAAQQHVMANVMDYHGTQLQRISSAIDRVENMLNTNGDKLKQLHLVRPKENEERREPRLANWNGPQSISL